MKETNTELGSVIHAIIGLLGGILIILAILQSMNGDVSDAIFIALLGIYCAISARD